MAEKSLIKLSQNLYYMMPFCTCYNVQCISYFHLDDFCRVSLMQHMVYMSLVCIHNFLAGNVIMDLLFGFGESDGQSPKQRLVAPSSLRYKDLCFGDCWRGIIKKARYAHSFTRIICLNKLRLTPEDSLLIYMNFVHL